MNKRFIHIDVAKGIGILFIVFSHNWILAHYKGEIIQVAYSFPVVMFFALSGIFFNADQPFLKLLVQKADSLLKPYFVTLILIEIVFHLFTAQDKSFGEALFGIFYASGNLLRFSPLWFLPNLFAVTIFAWIFINGLKIDRSRIIFNFLLLFVMLAIGDYFIRLFWGVIVTVNDLPLKRFDLPFSKIWGLPFSVDVVFITGFYFLLGYILRPKIETLKFNPYVFILAFISFCVLHYYSDNTMDINIRKYGELFSTTTIALLGIYMTLAISLVASGYQRLAAFFVMLGENSLIIYLFHTPIQEYSFLGLNMVSNFTTINAVIAYLLGVFAPLLLLQIITRVWLLRVLILPVKAQPISNPQNEAIINQPQNPLS